MLRLIPFVTAIIFFACRSSNKSDRVETSYRIIHNSVVRTSNAGDAFFAKAIQLLSEARNNRDSLIDTKEFEKLLDEVSYANETEFITLNLAKEPDAQIKYKEKAFKVLNMLSDVYGNEFTQFASIVNSKSENKIKIFHDLMEEKIKKIEEALIECDDAGKTLRKKYNIQ